MMTINFEDVDKVAEDNNLVFDIDDYYNSAPNVLFMMIMKLNERIKALEKEDKIKTDMLIDIGEQLNG